MNWFLRYQERGDDFLILIENDKELVGSFTCKDQDELNFWRDKQIPNDIPPDSRPVRKVKFAQ